MIELLIGLIIIVAIAYAAHWVIVNFFPEPVRMFALLIVGVIALVAILRLFGIGI